MRNGFRQALAMVAVLSVFVLAGCGSSANQAGPAKDAGKVTIDVWHFWEGHESEAFKKVAEAFMKANPNIEVKVLDGADEAKILTAISGGTPPDVAILPEAEPIAQWAQSGAIEPIDSYLQSASFDVKTVAPAALALGKWKGKQYALPFMADAWALYYNKDLFKAANLDPEKPPTTIEELNALAAKLTKKDGSGNLTQAGFIPSYTENHFPLYIWAFGGEIMKDGKFQLTSPNTVAAIQWSADFHKKLGVDAVTRFKSGFGKYDSPEAALYTGKVAMAVDGEWQIRFIDEFSPKLNYGVVPFPVVAREKDRLKGLTWFNVNSVILPKGAKHSKEAWAFMQFLETPAAMDLMTESIFNIPTLTTSASTNKLAQNPNFKMFIDLVNGPNARAYEPNPVAGELADNLTAFVEGADQGTVDITKTLAELQAKLQASYDKAAK